MTLSLDQIKTLLGVVAATTDDDMDCDDCFSKVAQFVEVELAGLELCDSMKVVKNHLANCPCCKDEFEALFAAMSEAGVQ